MGKNRMQKIIIPSFYYSEYIPFSSPCDLFNSENTVKAILVDTCN